MSSGGSEGRFDIFFAMTAITDTPLCVDCIGKRTHTSAEQASAMLTRLAATFPLKVGPRQCAACREQKTTFSITRDG